MAVVINAKDLSFSHVAIVFLKGNNNRIHFWYMSKYEALNILTNFDLSKRKKWII